MILNAFERVQPNRSNDPMTGAIRWDAAKSLWLFFMLSGGVAVIISAPSWTCSGGLILFLVQRIVRSAKVSLVSIGRQCALKGHRLLSHHNRALSIGCDPKNFVLRLCR